MVESVKDKIILFIILFLSVIIVSSSIKMTKQKREGKKSSVHTWSAVELEQAIILENQNAGSKEPDADVMRNKEDRTGYKSLYPNLYVENLIPFEMEDNKNKTAYLTFDDGPSQNTIDILETLRKYNVKASFFIIAKDMTETGEECLKTMAEEGHAIGVHSFCHESNIIYRNIDSFLEDFNQAYEIISGIVDTDVCMFRFPWGSYNGYLKKMKNELTTEMERRGFTYIDWNVSGEDSVGCPTKSSILRNIKKDLKRYDYPVILLHDSPSTELTARVLPDIIEMLMEEGYEFGTLYERDACQFKW